MRDENHFNTDLAAAFNCVRKTDENHFNIDLAAAFNYVKAKHDTLIGHPKNYIILHTVQ